MKHLGPRCVQFINRTYRRTGTLWEGRFRSCLAQSEDYVLGNDRFKQEIADMLNQHVEPGKAGSPVTGDVN